MSRKSAVQFNFSINYFVYYLIWCYLCVNINISDKLFASAKNLNTNTNNDGKALTCEHTKQYFDSMKMNMTINDQPDSENGKLLVFICFFLCVFLFVFFIDDSGGVCVLFEGKSFLEE
jgi:hypothetical protein